MFVLEWLKLMGFACCVMAVMILFGSFASAVYSYLDDKKRNET